MDTSELLALDQQHFWHPCSQMKDYEKFTPLLVSKARGSHIELQDGRKIIDAISSWWCKSLGHNHPRLKEALLQQIDKFEHVIQANTTNDTIIHLSQVLGNLIPELPKVFYAGDGSCAVEIALKMSLHARVLTGEPKRTKFIALKNGYHGETLGALSVSDVGLYRQPYQSLLFQPYFIPSIPYICNTSDPLWNDCSLIWDDVERSLEQYIQTTTAIIVEPIVQGAGGMQMYSKDFLFRLSTWANENNIHLIADEIMTGLGRTGKMLACEHANITPDFLCLSKGLTSGWMSFSAVITSDEIYNIFYDDYAAGKAFLHSHTYSGNALAASIALETINIIQEENLCERANLIGAKMYQDMCEVAEATGKLINVRGMGAIVAADLITDSTEPRLGFKIYQEAIKLGALLRPLGNTIYWLPPLNISLNTLTELKDITMRALLCET